MTLGGPVDLDWGGESMLSKTTSMLSVFDCVKGTEVGRIVGVAG